MTMQPRYLQEPTKPAGCTEGRDDCHIQGPRGMNSLGTIWRCVSHGRLFVADLAGKPSPAASRREDE